MLLAATALGAIAYAHQDYVAGFHIAVLTSGLVLLTAAIAGAVLPTGKRE